MLYANTDDGSSALWVCDGNGIVVDNISYSIGYRAPILEKINEHYGTSFTGWSENEISLRLGDTVPNWNAYEKIGLQIVKVKFPRGIFGEKRGDKLYIATSNGSNTIVVNVAGGFVETLQGLILSDDMKTYFTNAMNTAGYEVSETTSETLSLSVGDQIEGWEDYIQIA